MSLIGSLLAFVLIPMKARPAPVEGAKPPAPKEVENLADELRRTTFALNYWRDSGNALWKENQRLLAANWHMASQLRDQQAIAGQQALNAQMAQDAYNQGLYQRQALGQQNAYAYCNCVPSRAQAFDNENTHRQEG